MQQFPILQIKISLKSMLSTPFSLHAKNKPDSRGLDPAISSRRMKDALYGPGQLSVQFRALKSAISVLIRPESV